MKRVIRAPLGKVNIIWEAKKKIKYQIATIGGLYRGFSSAAALDTRGSGLRNTQQLQTHIHSTHNVSYLNNLLVTI